MGESAYNPDIHHRRSIRLPSFDYSSPGPYAVTLVANLSSKMRHYVLFWKKSGTPCQKSTQDSD